MPDEYPHSVAVSRHQRLAMIAATICFLIGWFHTGQGLSNYRILGSEYGGFVLATGLLLIMILAYNKAIKGAAVGLGFYLLCAAITFVCNINSFYPNYRANSLIREELRQHRTHLGDLRESIKTAFQDVQLNAMATSVREKSGQLQKQCKMRGFGPLTEQVLKDIEGELGRTFTRLRLGSTQEDWDRCARDYAELIENALQAKLSENRYVDKLNDMRQAEDYYTLFSRKIDETLADTTEIKQVPAYVEDLIKGYRDSCKKAMSLLADEKKNKNLHGEKTKSEFSCSPAYSSPNVELNTFSHTFKSVWATLSDGGTLAVVLISLFIDFLVPLALYLLVRVDANSEDGAIWVSGGKRVGPSVRS